jgi:PIN domain nuclease of toxin-antitoxin system
MEDYWESITAEELRIAAKVARASGGVVMVAAAEAWEMRANLAEGQLELGVVFD